jgi:hypothetical protein
VAENNELPPLRDEAACVFCQTAVSQPGAPCADCGILTLPGYRTPAGPRATSRAEFYMIHDDLWQFVTGPCGWHLFLCIGCLEWRLGRRLTPDDFTAAPVNDLWYTDDGHLWSWRSPRLVARLRGHDSVAVAPGRNANRG